MAKYSVIGSGLGGLAAAIRLRARGHDVQVFERLDTAGGRARVFEHEGYRFDAGPTVITAPFLIDELFELAGLQRQDYIELLPVTPWYRYLLADGRHFDYGSNAEQVLAEVSRFSPSDTKGYIAMRAYCKALYREGFEKRGDISFNTLFSMLRAVPALLRLRADRSVYAAVSRYIKNTDLREILSVHPLLVGGHPFRTSAIYMLIHHLEQAHGVWYVRGGTGALIEALVTVAKSMGIVFHFGYNVEQVRVVNRQVREIAFSNGHVESVEGLVSNLDPVHLYSKLWQSDQPMRRWKPNNLARLRHSMGLYVLYFATNKRYEQVAHHSIILDKPYRQQLDDIFDGSELPESFSAYLHKPSATDNNAAPEGQDAFYVLIPVPNLKSGLNWEEIEPGFRNIVIDFLEHRCLPDLRANLSFAFSKTPQYFADDLNSSFGTGFSIHPDLLQSAWFRFHNRSEEADNLYLVGAGTHPGAGVPGVLSSARVLDRLIPYA